MSAKGQKVGEVVYPLEDVERGLLAVIQWRGSFDRAARELDMDGTTLRKWALEQYPELYRKLSDDYAEVLEAELVGELRENARIAGRAVREGILRTQDAIVNGYERSCPRCAGSGFASDGETDCGRCSGEGTVFEKLEGKELASATLQLAKISSSAVDKVLALTGRPTDGRDAKTEDVLAIVRELAGAGVVKLKNQADADSTAEDVSEADRPAA